MNELVRPITFLQPPRIAFGVGCACACASDFAERGFTRIGWITTKRAFLQTEALRAVFAEKSIELVPFTSIPAEPTIADFEFARAELKHTKLDAIVGCGGGSVLDIAKLIAAMHHRSERVETFFGTGLLPARTLPLACLPTTAGSGSEVSPNAILLDAPAQLKKGVISPHLVPDAAYVDPSLTVSAPASLTAATGIDALVHCLEAFANKRAHPVADTYALEGLRLISGHLAEAVRNGSNLAARSAVALGSLYGGLCLGPVNTAGVHALAYPLGSIFKIAHGLANALMLVPVLRFNLPAAPERYAAVARALGVTLDSRDPKLVAEAGLRKLEELIEACGLPRGLSACGVATKDIPTLVASGMQVTRLLVNNPREITAADALAIFQQAL